MSFTLFCIPASGSNFVGQLAIMQHLCEIGITPNLMLGSSGGNLVAYISAAADFHWASILRISKDLKPKLFCKPWSTFKPAAALIGFFNGNAYNQGEGLSEFLQNYFTYETITKYQIVTGTYNKDLQKIRLFFNCNENDAVIKSDAIDYDLTESQSICYMDGNFDLISTAGLASASIPGLVPPQKIDGYDYSDGASSINSPMTILQSALMKSLNPKDSLHIVYINCKDLSQATIIPNHNLLDTWKQAVNDLIKSQTLIDRLAAHELLRSRAPGEMKKTTFVCNYDNLLEVVELKKKVKYTLLEIYPTVASDLNITDFDANDIDRNIRTIYPSCQCHLWWIEN